MRRGVSTPRLSIVIPTLDPGERLTVCLDAVSSWPEALDIVIADGGSRDGTIGRAAARGARVVSTSRGRGVQLRHGADAAVGAWLLFLHADTVLAPGWVEAVRAFIGDPKHSSDIAAFAFALDDPAPAARRLERIVAWRCRHFALPYGDQGLLIARPFYDRIGGFRPLPIMEDVDIMRRVPGGRLHILPVKAVTSADRYRAGGYWLRPLRNLTCQALWRLGVPAPWIARAYR
jgi:rSAM/selenodomain-associated transferase 2